MNEPSPLERSLFQLVDRLLEHSTFPKYSLERRVDVFLLPFLEAMLRAKFDPGARLVAPEFPVLADLREAGPYATLPTSDDEESRSPKLSRRTVNVDYLFHLPGPPARWLFVELKTDVRSFDSDQADLYAIARLRGMSRLRTDLEFVCRNTRQRRKYETLLDAMPRTSDGEPLKIAYLAPRELERRGIRDHEFPRTAEQKELCRRSSTGKALDAGSTAASPKTLDHLLALEDLADFARGVDPRFAPLWPAVKRLLEGLLRGARGRSAT